MSFLVMSQDKKNLVACVSLEVLTAENGKCAALVGYDESTRAHHLGYYSSEQAAIAVLERVNANLRANITPTLPSADTADKYLKRMGLQGEQECWD